MKQNLPPANSKHSGIKHSRILLELLLLVAGIFSLSGCATQPRSSSVAVQHNLDSSSAPTSVLININTASAVELERLPGVGRIIAERIVAHREQFGSFRRAEHLLMVRGISDRKFRQMRTMIVAE